MVEQRVATPVLRSPPNGDGPHLRLTASRQLLVPLIVACALFMQSLDSTVIATALPTIARSLHETALRLNVAITCYLLSLSVFIPISGWTADRFGARRVFGSAIVVFTLGSIACGLSNTLASLVAARILQGMGGALMVPVGRLLLLRTVPKSDLLRAMSFVSVPALVGPVIGPPLGGFIVTYASWRWIFFINIPAGILGIVLVNLLVGDLHETGRRPLDRSGFALTAIGLASLAFGFENIGRGALPLFIVLGLLAVGALCLTIYVRHARRVDHPIIDLALFKIPTYAIASIGGFLFRTGLGALPFLMPLMLQVGFGLSALHSGLLTFASAAGAMLMKTSAVRILRLWGFRFVLALNAVISAGFLFGYSLFRPTTSHLVIFFALLVGGFFRSLQMTSINTLSYADVPASMLSRATSLSSMAQQLSQTTGVAIAALLLHVVLTLRGGTGLVAVDFYPVFIGVALISLSSVPFFLRMSPDAGAEVSGHAPAR
ncbi:MAG: DHA2 family efflux MFS transporter permease subunit [Stellaceae bacterium]